MNIIIAGCGKIGTAVISALVSEGHNVTAMDKSLGVIDELTNIYDIMGVCGNCADCETLEEAMIGSCDIFVAATGTDEVNMLSCYIARSMGAKHTVARIRDPEYNDRSLSFMSQTLELSMALNPELLLAQDLHNLIKIPSAFKVEYFSKRNLEMIEVRLKSDSDLVGKKLSRIRGKEKEEFLIGAVLRGDNLYIPDGNFELQAGDLICIFASPADMQKLLKSLNMLKKAVKDVMIIGGSKTAFYLSKILATTGTNVKIVEKDRAVCEKLSESLPHTTIIHGDGSHHDTLMEEGLNSIDAFVALTGIDEENILTSLFAEELNVPRVVAKINNNELTKMAEKLGLGGVISTKSVTADILTRYARAVENSMGSNIETLYKFMDGKAEALEFRVNADSEVVGTPIKDLKISRGILIAGIIKPGNKASIVTGNDIIEAGDKVIVLASGKRLSDLDDILR